MLDAPACGHLLSDMVVDDGDSIDVSGLLWPRIEVSIAFVLGRTLPSDGCTEADVLAATDYVTPAIELTEDRIRGSRTIVIGRCRCSPGGVDFSDINAVLYAGYEGREVVVTNANSAAVLDNPLAAVASLVNTMAPLGVRLHAGHVILSGSCTRGVDVAAGDRFRAEIAAVGSVSIEFH